MPEETALFCPLCGKRVPPDANKCPVCSTQLDRIITARNLNKVIETRVMQKIEGKREREDDFLHGELPSVKLPEVKITCPGCSMELKGGEAKCPRCGIPLASESTLVECPECGAVASSTAPSCPSCGVTLGEEQVSERGAAEAFPEAQPAPEPLHRPVRPLEAVTTIPHKPSVASEKGVVNGRGAINGTGLVNGRGAVNGTGLVNGTGIVNGTRGIPAPPVGRRKQLLTRWQFLAVLVALVVVVPTFVYISYSRNDGALAIDGDYDDWRDTISFGMRTLSSSAAINVVEWSVQVKDTRLYWYVESEADMMQSALVSSFFMFVDADDSASTGYSVGGIGADYMFELDGWNGSVESGTLAAYSSTTEHHDWNRWQDVSSLAHSLDGNRFEAMGTVPGAISASAKCLLVSQDEAENRAASYPVPRTGGVLIVTQEPSPTISSTGIVQSSTTAGLLRLRFSCEGASGSVLSVDPQLVGATSASSISAIHVGIGDEEVVDITVDTSSLPAGSFVSASISSDNIESTYSEVIILGDGAKAYVESPPPSISVDGAFADWTGKTYSDTDEIPIPNQNVDMSSVGSEEDASSAFFYISVDGEMCSGSYVPVVRAKPTGGGGGGGTVLPKTAEDWLRVYIDSDTSSSSGYQISMSSKLIGADYMVEVRGLNAEIVSKTLYVFSTGEWDQTSAYVAAGKDLQRLELGVALSQIGGDATIDFIFETTDWKGRTDYASYDPVAARSLTGGLTMAFEPERWVVDAATSSPSATAMSYQRKLFYDGTNFWSFYFDGTNTVHEYSADGGLTWISRGNVFSTAGMNEVSVWYDSTNRIVYAVGDRSTASADVYVQRGTVTPSTATISWASSDSTISVSSSYPVGGKNTFICKDANGYLWVLSSLQNSTSPARYQLAAYRSNSVDSISGWTFSSYMLAAHDPTDVKGSIVPIGSGSNVWAIYTYNGKMESRKYTGTWGAPDTFYPGTAYVDNTNTAPPSAVVDSNGVVHVVYGDGHQQGGVTKPHIYYTYNRGSSWVTPIPLSTTGNPDNFICPTISLDTSTGNLFAFWIDAGSASDPIVGKKNVSGIWTSINFGTQTNDAKNHLTSIYSVSGESRICWQWTQNTSAPIHVVFDKIPEFSDAVLPVLIITVLFIAVPRCSRRKTKDA